MQLENWGKESSCFSCWTHFPVAGNCIILKSQMFFARDSLMFLDGRVIAGWIMADQRVAYICGPAPWMSAVTPGTGAPPETQVQAAPASILPRMGSGTGGRESVQWLDGGWDRWGSIAPVAGWGVGQAGLDLLLEQGIPVSPVICPNRRCLKRHCVSCHVV